MRKPSLVFWFLLICFLHFGCSNQAAKNRNAQVVANYNKSINSNSQNLNGNSNTNSNADSNSPANVENEEVPTFSEPNEALRKGDEYLDSNNTRNAIAAFKQATDLDPDLAEGHFKLGIAYALLESVEDAQNTNSNVNQPGEKRSSKPKKKNSERSFENAVKAYRKIVRKDRKDHSAYYNLGRSYNKLYDDKEAGKALQKAVDLNPENSLYRTELGAVLIKLAKYASAVKQLNKAIELDEENFRAEDLLVKAKAGQKRTGFKSKKPKQRKKGSSTRSQRTPTQTEDTRGKENPNK